MPQPPYQYRSLETSKLLDLSSLGSRLQESEKKRQDAFEVSRQIQMGLTAARDQLECRQDALKSTESSLKELESSLCEALSRCHATSGDDDESSGIERQPREANLGVRVEDFVRLLSFYHFLSTGGQLLPPSSVSKFATDEEYLAGACMGLCQDLARYGLGRATARDVDSVEAARDLVQELLDYLLKFDFRNGHLRRKYDGTKYALKSLETILYELSVTGATNNATGNEGEEKAGDADMEPDSKRTKIENDSSTKIHDELEGIRKRIEHRDELRERLIKKCRDGQKAAKQAIYALHRNDQKKAEKLLEQCEKCINSDLLPIVQEEPPLRSGSFSNVMEEYAEAKLFYTWLLGKDGWSGTGESEKTRTILKIEDFEISLEPDEYLGGLCDLTGEIGRYAVQRGTARDFDGVKECLESNASIHVAIQSMPRFPGSIGKKLDQLRRSVEKLERMTYEMSLSEAAGGRKLDSEDLQPAESENYNS